MAIERSFRRSRLIASVVNRQARQLTAKPAQSIPLKTNVFNSVVVPNVPSQAGIKANQVEDDARPMTNTFHDCGATRNWMLIIGSAGMV
jgi:hypothetical protein